jgi:hypothetical protein
MRHVHSAPTASRLRPPLFLVPLLAGAFLVATGCSSTYRITRDSDGYSRVTEDLTGKTVRVTLRDGRTITLENLYVGPDSTMGVSPRGNGRVYPTSSLQEVEYFSRGMGFLRGAGVGVLGPVAAGLVAGGTGRDPGNRLSREIGLALSVPGGLLGGLIGVIQGHRKTYLIEVPPPDASQSTPGTEAPTGPPPKLQ